MRSLAHAFLSAILLLAFAVRAEAKVVYVRADAQLTGGDGTRARPYRRITDALVAVRQQAGRQTTIIDVGPGTYVGAYSAALLAANPEWERLPLYIDASRLHVRGATRIKSGLGRGEPLVLEDDDTLLTVGERLFSSLPASSVQAIIAVGPTTAHPEVSQVRITGLHFDGVHHEGVGIMVDRVPSFAVERNVFERLSPGTRSRASSGSWSHNYATANRQGAVLTGGSLEHPARLRIVGNRSVRNDLLGALLVGTGFYLLGTHTGTTGYEVPPLQTVFDMDVEADRQSVPNTLVAEFTDNDFSDNGWIGLRLFVTAIRAYTYNTASVDQPVVGNLDLVIAGNHFDHNGFTSGQTFGYGASLDAGFPNRVLDGVVQPDYTGTYALAFSDNTFEDNLTAGLFAGLTRFGINATYKAARGALVQIDTDMPISTVYDHPECDPFDPTHTPLGNEVLLNGAAIPVNAPFCPPH